MNRSTIVYLYSFRRPLKSCNGYGGRLECGRLWIRFPTHIEAKTIKFAFVAFLYLYL